jgi:hypothetical protein
VISRQRNGSVINAKDIQNLTVAARTPRNFATPVQDEHCGPGTPGTGRRSCRPDITGHGSRAKCFETLKDSLIQLPLIATTKSLGREKLCFGSVPAV